MGRRKRNQALREASSGARRATDEASLSAPRPDVGRFSSQRKTDAVLRLLRGEQLDALSRELGVTAARLSNWRDRFLQGGASALKSDETDPASQEIQRMKGVIADLTMRLELQRERNRALEANLPLARRKPRF